MSTKTGLSKIPHRSVQLTVETSDILTYPTDLLLLKYAQGLHGTDRSVTKALGPEFFLPPAMPRVGDHRLVPSQDKLGAAQVLFVGVPPLRDFGYREIRDFARTGLTLAGHLTQSVKRVAMTVHGPSLGLDEIECFEALIAGLLDALVVGTFPPILDQIAIVEREERRADRFSIALNRLV
jgi:hypothetical protein